MIGPDFNKDPALSRLSDLVMPDEKALAESAESLACLTLRIARGETTPEDDWFV